MTDYNELLERLEDGDDLSARLQAATAIRTLLAERQAGPVRYVKPVDAAPGTWITETAESAHDAPIPDRWNEAIEAAAKACEDYLKDCLEDRDIQKGWARTKATNAIYAKQVRALKQTEGER